MPVKHPRRRRAIPLGLAILFAAAGLATPVDARDILLFAPASTADVMNAVANEYPGKTGRIRASYASSGVLARQIEKGAPADLYVSANVAWIDWAEKRKLLLSGSIVRLFGNRLVLIAPHLNRNVLKIAEGFPLLAAIGDNRLAIADPDHVPAGIYARHALQHLKVWDVVAERTARARDVRAALAQVERGEAPLGIVYRTDALLSKKVRILDTFPEKSHPPIVYSLAIVAAHDAKEVRGFYEFLRSPAAAAIYVRFGFQPGW